MKLLYFYNDECQPCVVLRKKVEEMIEKEFPKIVIEYVSPKEDSLRSARCNVFSTPTILIEFEGKEIIREAGIISIPNLRDKIRRYEDIINQ